MESTHPDQGAAISFKPRKPVCLSCKSRLCSALHRYSICRIDSCQGRVSSKKILKRSVSSLSSPTGTEKVDKRAPFYSGFRADLIATVLSNFQQARECLAETACDSNNAKIRTSQRKPAIQVLVGDHGAGKTWLARQYSKFSEESQCYSSVMWLDGASQLSLDASWRRIAILHGILPMSSQATPRMFGELLHSYLKRLKRCFLLVIDDVACLPLLTEHSYCLPVTECNCDVLLIGSQHSDWSQLLLSLEDDFLLAGSVGMPALTDAELTKLLEGSFSTAHVESVVPETLSNFSTLLLDVIQGNHAACSIVLACRGYLGVSMEYCINELSSLAMIIEDNDRPSGISSSGLAASQSFHFMGAKVLRLAVHWALICISPASKQLIGLLALLGDCGAAMLLILHTDCHRLPSDLASFLRATAPSSSSANPKRMLRTSLEKLTCLVNELCALKLLATDEETSGEFWNVRMSPGIRRAVFWHIAWSMEASELFDAAIAIQARALHRCCVTVKRTVLLPCLFETTIPRMRTKIQEVGLDGATQDPLKTVVRDQKTTFHNLSTLTLACFRFLLIDLSIPVSKLASMLQDTLNYVQLASVPQDMNIEFELHQAHKLTQLTLRNSVLIGKVSNILRRLPRSVAATALPPLLVFSAESIQAGYGGNASLRGQACGAGSAATGSLYQPRMTLNTAMPNIILLQDSYVKFQEKLDELLQSLSAGYLHLVAVIQEGQKRRGSKALVTEMQGRDRFIEDFDGFFLSLYVDTLTTLRLITAPHSQFNLMMKPAPGIGGLLRIPFPAWVVNRGLQEGEDLFVCSSFLDQMTSPEQTMARHAFCNLLYFGAPRLNGPLCLLLAMKAMYFSLRGDYPSFHVLMDRAMAIAQHCPQLAMEQLRLLAYILARLMPEETVLPAIEVSNDLD